MLLGDIVTRNARRQPKSVALSYGALQLTFGELDDRASRLAEALGQLGMRPGDRLAILADNSPEYIETLFAAALAGLVVVPINTRLKKEDIAFILQDSEAATVIVGEACWETVKAVRPQLTAVSHFVTVGKGSGKTYEELALGTSSRPTTASLNDEDLYCIAYTGGTTGLPKGAMLSHRNVLAAVVDGVVDFGINSKDVGLVCHPLFHISALWALFTHFYLGGRCVLMKQFEPRSFLETIEREKVTCATLASPLVIALLQQPDVTKYSLKSLRVVLYAGTPLPAEVLKQAVKVFGNVFYGCYALTEAVTCVTVLRPEDQALDGTPQSTHRLSSCGHEGTNVEVRVVDEDGTQVSPGQVGEIIVRADSVMKGYWKQPIRTAETLRNGFLYTGDLATVDEDGFIYTFDRKVDTIISGGQRVSSKEVEEVIYRCPAVQEAAVIGVPDKELGEAIQAVVVLKAGKKAVAKDILEVCRTSLPRHAVPQAVHFVDSLPRNALGKVLKRALRQEYGEKKAVA